MTKNKLVNQGAVRRVYRQIILLGMLVHVLYVALFGGLGMSGMVYYNVGSTLFYMAMLVLVFYGRYRMAVTLIHLEVCVFVNSGNVCAGVGCGSSAAADRAGVVDLYPTVPAQLDSLYIFSAGNRRICVFEDGLGSRWNDAGHFHMSGKRRLFV